MFRNQLVFGYFYYRIVLLTLSILLIINAGIFCDPAIALLRQHHETQEILRYHAQDSLKDRAGNTWQVLLFPDNSHGATTLYYLRLVGFPGINSFSHHQPLEILTSQGQIFSASDVFSESAPAPNVGQYDLTKILSQIPSSVTLKLTTPLEDNQELGIKIPQEVVAEWQLLIQEIES